MFSVDSRVITPKTIEKFRKSYSHTLNYNKVKSNKDYLQNSKTLEPGFLPFKPEKQAFQDKIHDYNNMNSFHNSGRTRPEHGLPVTTSYKRSASPKNIQIEDNLENLIKIFLKFSKIIFSA